MSRYPGIQTFYDYRQYSVDDIKEKSESLKKDILATYDQVGSVAPDKVSFETVIQPLIDMDREGYTRGVALQLPAMVALKKDLRDASTEAEKDLEDLMVEVSMRKDVFDNVVAFSNTEEAATLSPENKRYLNKIITEGKRSGLQLPEDQQEELKTLKKRMSELSVNFSKNLNEDTSHIFFNEQELDGVPADLIKSLEKNEEGKLKVTMKYPHYFPVMRKCRVPKTRYLMEKTFNSRCREENTAILEELLELRQKHADMLGYPNHAAFIQEIRMAKNPQNVAEFLNTLKEKLHSLWHKEREVMLKLKEDESKELGLEFDGKLNYEDFSYYKSMVEEKHYAVDQNALKEYFPIEVVTAGLMDIYQRILGLKFTRVEDGEVWGDDVEMWQVDDAKTGEIMGYFYLDLYPRDGKYGHACMLQLQQGCLDAEGKKQKSVVAMICNFSKSTEEKPSLLDHKEVETYFHEFGHVMHGICSKAKTSKFFGTHVERDFVEAPSQMLENWVWEEEPLLLMSKHYKDGTELPKEMLKKLVASRNANAGIFNLRQIYLSTFDQRLHTQGKCDSAKLAQELHKEFIGVDTIPGTNFAATFGHLVGYDGQYYGYMWSEVFSQDMFSTRFEQEGILNPKTGMDYRNLILAPGGSKDGLDLVTDFLGREPNQKAFLKSKGLE